MEQFYLSSSTESSPPESHQHQPFQPPCWNQVLRSYKVMRATKAFGEPTTLQVFTVRTGSWRYISDINHIWFSQGSEYTFPLEKHGFLLNETLHWVAVLREVEYEEGTLVIVSFSLSEVKFRVMVSFPCRRPPRFCPIPTSMVMVGNSLLVYHDFNIWTMKEYGVEETWTRVLCISPEGLPRHFDNLLRPLCLLENGEVLLNHREELGLHNPEEKTLISVIWNCEERYPPYVAYVETLVSPVTVTGESEGARTYLVAPYFQRSVKSAAREEGVPPGWIKKGRRRKRQRPKPAA